MIGNQDSSPSNGCQDNMTYYTVYEASVCQTHTITYTRIFLVRNLQRSEWVIKFKGLSRTAEGEVHVSHLFCKGENPVHTFLWPIFLIPWDCLLLFTICALKILHFAGQNNPSNIRRVGIFKIDGQYTPCPLPELSVHIQDWTDYHCVYGCPST